MVVLRAARATPRAYIGTSGWVYPSWRKHLYAGVPARAWLTTASRTFGALEINGSFYVQIKPATFRRWRDETPEGFRFAMKGHRFVTHYRRLRDVGDSVRRVRAPALELGDKLAAVIWQLPAQLSADVARLGRFLEVLVREWPETRHAIELRHASWFTEEVARLLGEARVANVLGDAPDFPMWRAVTTDLVYVRLHGHTRKYASSYAPASLRAWAADARRWLDEGRDVHIYLDNDAEGAAVKNALDLRRRLEGLSSAALPRRARDHDPASRRPG